MLFFKKSFKAVFLSVLCLAAVAASAQDLLITSPSSADTIHACDEFSSDVLVDPWDMSQSSDVVNFMPANFAGFSSPAFSGGVFSARNVSQYSPGRYYLIVPGIGGAYPAGGRFGHNLELDTAKYRKLVIRAYYETADYRGMKIVWQRGFDTENKTTVTSSIAIRQGWNTYEIDLNSIQLSAGESSDMISWSAAPVTGLSIIPTYGDNNYFAVDWVRLIDPSSCASYKVEYTVNGGNSAYVNLYLDDDADVTNGYISQILTKEAATQNAELNVDMQSAGPGSYRVSGYAHNDFATLSENPWNMNSSASVYQTAGLSSISYSGGAMQAHVDGGGAIIYLNVPGGGINAAAFSKLSMKFSSPVVATSPPAIWWMDSNGSPHGGIILWPNTYDADHDAVFQVNLGSNGEWAGTISQFMIAPSVAGTQANISIDFVSLRSSGYVTSLAGPAYVVGSGSISINSPPLFSFLSPDARGGEGFAAWEMKPGTFKMFTNLRGEADPSYPAESYSSYLPDVRWVDGLRGDFFKGTNTPGNDDPSTFMLYRLSNPAPAIDAARYKHFCFKELVDHEFDGCLGSVARIIWEDAAGNQTVGDDIVLITNRWGSSRWYEYCVDLSKMFIQHGVPWQGAPSTLRLDPHEFSRDTCVNNTPTGNPTSVSFYYDYISLRKNAESRGGKLAISYLLQDIDDAAPAVSLYYSADKTGAAKTLIAGGLSKENGTVIWDTGSVPDGDYWLFGEASDGVDNVLRRSALPVSVVGSNTSTGQAPILSLEAPSISQNVCNSLQVKGYALQPERAERLAAVEVWIDNALQDTFQPSEYSQAAANSYPSVESSNSGFNRAYDLTGMPAGQHSLRVKAISSDGVVTDSGPVAFSIGVGPCTLPMVDGEPNGQPVAAPIVVVPNVTKPKISKASFSKSEINVWISGAAQSKAGCSVQLYASAKKGAAPSLIGTYNPNGKATLKLKARKIAVNSKKVKSVILSANKTCQGYNPGSSGGKTLALSGSGKIKTFSALLKKLKTLKKV